MAAENYLYEGIIVTTFGVIDSPQQTPTGSPSTSSLLVMMIKTPPVSSIESKILAEDYLKLRN